MSIFHETPPPSFVKTVIGYGVADGWDLGWTNDCIDRGICQELNPIFHSRPRRVLGKALLFGALPTASYLAERKTSGKLRIILKVGRWTYWTLHFAAGSFALYNSRVSKRRTVL